PQLVDRVNEAQKQAGDLKELQSRQHNGVKYFGRVERKESNYYYVRGSLLVFATREDLLRRVIDLDRQAAPDGEAPAAREFRLLGMERRLASLWINPRAFEP